MTRSIRNDRRALVAGLAGAPFVATLPRTARAQDARRPLTLVVPYAAGGGTDIFARLYAEALAPQVGGRVIVENRAGANGAIGLQHVANSPPDGRTLVYGYGNLALVQLHSMKNPPVNILRDLAPVIRTVLTQSLIVTAANAPWKDLSDFLAAARREPGRRSYADYGELAIATMIAASGVQLMRVPYKGGAPASVDVAAGHVDIVANSAAQAMTNLRTGKVKPLAVSSDERMPEFPNVPTVREILPSFRAPSYQGVFAPKDTPRAVIDELYERSAAVLNRPEMRKEVLARHAVVGTMRPDEFRAFMEADSQNIAAVLKSAGVTPQ